MRLKNEFPRWTLKSRPHQLKSGARKTGPPSIGLTSSSGKPSTPHMNRVLRVPQLHTDASHTVTSCRSPVPRRHNLRHHRPLLLAVLPMLPHRTRPRVSPDVCFKSGYAGPPGRGVTTGRLPGSARTPHITCRPVWDESSVKMTSSWQTALPLH